jgi:zinc and cadmium transporter
MPVVLLIVYCTLILLASLAGGWLPLMVRLTHRRMQLAVSCVAGVMLGVGLLGLLPHALAEAPDATDTIFTWVVIGFLVMFFIERFFCFHHHDAVLAEPGHEQEHAHDAADHAGCHHARGDSHHDLTWSGAAVGLTLHTVINGVALAAAVEAASQPGQAAALAGLGTFLVVFLHKPFDAMTISTLMTAGGWSLAARHVVNTIFALMIPAGVVLFYLGLGHAHGGGHLVAYALAFSAGTFLCISMSDLLPELQFHSHDRTALSLALLLGLLVAWLIGAVETRFSEHHAHPASTEAQDAGHDHGEAEHEH